MGKLPFVSMLITSCSQHSTPNHLVSLLGSRLTRRPVQGPRAPEGAWRGPGPPREVQRRVCGKFPGPQGRLGSFHFEIKSSPASREGGGGGFAQSLGTAALGGGTGSKVDGKRSAGTREEQMGFPEPRARGAARSRRVDRARAPGRPAGRARARPPRRAPARGAALRASGPSPRRPAPAPAPAPAPSRRARTQAEPWRKLLTRG